MKNTNKILGLILTIGSIVYWFNTRDLIGAVIIFIAGEIVDLPYRLNSNKD